MSNVEELLEQLENAEEDNTTSHDTTVTFFLKKYNITAGETFVGGQVLFKLYKATVPTSMDYASFRLEMGQYLLFNRTGTKINLSASKISEETFKLLSKKKRKVNNKGLKSFNYFLGLYKVNSGSSWIEAQILYSIYRKTFKGKRRPPLSPPEFNRFADLHFKHTITDNVKWYGITKDIYSTINKEEIEEIRNERKEGFKNERKTRRRKERSREKDNQEVKVEVQSSTSRSESEE